MCLVFVADLAVLSSAGGDGISKGLGAIERGIPLVAGAVVLGTAVRKPVRTAYFKF